MVTNSKSLHNLSKTEKERLKMTENNYLEQAEKDRLELEQHRLNYMADDTSIEPSDIPKLLEIVRKLQAEDTTLNIYELYKHPEARAKLFSQIPEALLYGFEYDTDTSPKIGILRVPRTAIRNNSKKVIASTDKQALGELLDLLELPAETKSQFIRDIAVSGLLSKD